MLLWSPHGCSAKTPCVVAAEILRPRKVQQRCSCHAGQSQWVWAEMHFLRGVPLTRGLTYSFLATPRNAGFRTTPQPLRCSEFVSSSCGQSLSGCCGFSVATVARSARLVLRLFDGFCASSDARAEPSVMRFEHPCRWLAGLSSLGCWYHPQKKGVKD